MSAPAPPETPTALDSFVQCLKKVPDPRSKRGKSQPFATILAIVLLRLDKEVRRGGELLSFETRYFVSSLDPSVVSASEFQDSIQRHWEVENCLHWQKDRYFEEDKHVVHGWSDVWTVLTNMALSLTRLLWQGERTLREVAERCQADPMPTAYRLGFCT